MATRWFQHPLRADGELEITPTDLAESLLAYTQGNDLTVSVHVGHNQEFVKDGAVIGRELQITRLGESRQGSDWDFGGILYAGGSLAPRDVRVSGVLEVDRLVILELRPYDGERWRGARQAVTTD